MRRSTARPYFSQNRKWGAVKRDHEMAYLNGGVFRARRCVAATGGHHDAIEFEHQQHRGKRRGRQSRARDELVERGRRVLERGEQARVCRDRARAMVRAWCGRRRASSKRSRRPSGEQPADRVQVLDDLLRGLDELRTIADQPMAAVRQRVVDRAGQREDLAALLGGQARGDQRSRVQAGLDHERAQAQAGDDAVAAREMLGRAGMPGGNSVTSAPLSTMRARQFRRAGAGRRDRSGAEYRDRLAARIQRGRCARRRRLLRPARWSRCAAGGERARERLCVVESAGGRVARADDRDLRRPQAASDRRRRTARPAGWPISRSSAG